jgi:hypothetical protein
VAATSVCREEARTLRYAEGICSAWPDAPLHWPLKGHSFAATEKKIHRKNFYRVEFYLTEDYILKLDNCDTSLTPYRSHRRLRKI